MTNSLRIGIDGRFFAANPKGIAKYLLSLCAAIDSLLPEAQFFVYSYKQIALPVASPRWHLRIDTSPRKHLPNSFWLAFGAGFLSHNDNLDVFWGGTGILPLLGLHSRTVLTVHDFVYQIMPETCSRRALWSARLFMGKSISRADAIVTNSAGTARRLQKASGHSAAAIVRPGLAPLFRPASEFEIATIRRHFTLEKPYLLNVATREPRKNLPLLIRTFLHMKEQGLMSDHSLVLAGDAGWKDQTIAAAIAQAGDSIRLIGYAQEAQLPALYSGSDAFIFPSKYEGFGMPVLEARACGTRVVTTDIPELREAGGKSATYITPTEESLRDGILRALASPRPRPLPQGSHSWTRSASVMATVFRCLASSGQKQPQGLRDVVNSA